MSLLNKFKTKISFEKFLTIAISAAITILIFSCIKYIYYGSVNWDEPFQLHSLESHIGFAKSVLKGNIRNYQDLPSNMEWYGVGLKLIYALPRLVFESIANKNKLILYSLLRGFGLIIYIVSGFIFYNSSNFYQKRKSKILLLIYFTFPLLAGESYLNITDIPFAICFSFYSLMNGIIIIKNKKSFKNNHFRKKNIFENIKVLNCLSTLSAALLINSKASMAAPILIIEILFGFYSSPSFWKFYRNFINAIKIILIRLFAVLGFTYLITPVSWVEPFKYYGEVIKAFSKWSGRHAARIGGVDLINNTDKWSLFEYLWRWLHIKIPIIMIFLFLIFVVMFSYKLIFKKENYRSEAIINPILIFYGLQLILTPTIAIMANSSSYNALRHWCFIYPPLIIYTSFVIDNYFLNFKDRKFDLISKFFTIIFTIFGTIDNILMMPYSNISFNLYGRRFVNPENTDIDYWGYSSGEIFKKPSIMGYQVRSPEAPFKTNTAHTPHHINNRNYKYPYAYGTHTRENMKTIDEKCRDVETVSRNILFRKKPIILSKIGICPVHTGNKWNIWSTNDGKVEIENKINQHKLTLPSHLDILSLKKINEEEKSNLDTLTMIFSTNGKPTIEELVYKKNFIEHKTYLIPQEGIFLNYLKNYSNPITILGNNNQTLKSDWELGINNKDISLKKVYENKFIELVSLNKKYLGIVCKLNEKEYFRTIIKKDTGELLERNIDNLIMINNPDSQPGTFFINKVDCKLDNKNNLEKIFIYDTNLKETYRWEIELDGTIKETIFLKNKKSS